MVYPEPVLNAPLDLHPPASKWVRFAIGLLIFVSLALPSGSLFGVPVKYMAFGVAVLSLLVLWGRHSIPIARWIIAFAVLVSAFVTFYILIGLLQGTAGPPFILKEATGFFTTVFVLMVILAARSQQAIDDADVARFAFYGAFVFALWKSLIVFGLVYKVLTYDTVEAFFLEQAGYRLVSSGIFGGWVRINLIIYDFVVAFMLFLVATYPVLFAKVPRFMRVAFLIVGLACLVFAFSRLLFGVVLALMTFSFFFRFGKRTKVIVAVLAVVMATASAPWLTGAFEQRFNSSGNKTSDSLRNQQIDALLESWDKVPLLGGGFGYYSKTMVRDPGSPYNYEVQWMGFLAKLGALGVLMLGMVVGAMYLHIFKGPVVADHYVLAFALSCFVLGGFTNQYLVTSGSAVFYGLILTLSNYFRMPKAAVNP